MSSLLRRQRQRAEQYGDTSRFTGVEWTALLEKYKYRCLRCGRYGQQLTVDHIIPLCKGGTNTIDNVQPLCVTCNVKKQSMIKDYRVR